MDFLKQISLKWKYFTGTLFYLSYSPNAYFYSRKRDRLEREFTPPPSGEAFDNPGKHPFCRGGAFSQILLTQRYASGGVASMNIC
jgi:alpha-glucosidase